MKQIRECYIRYKNMSLHSVMDTLPSYTPPFTRNLEVPVWLPRWECSLSTSSHFVLTFFKPFKAWSALLSRPLHPCTTLLQARATLTCRLASCLGRGARVRPSPCSYLVPGYLKLLKSIPVHCTPHFSRAAMIGHLINLVRVFCPHTPHRGTL